MKYRVVSIWDASCCSRTCTTDYYHTNLVGCQGGRRHHYCSDDPSLGPWLYFSTVGVVVEITWVVESWTQLDTNSRSCSIDRVASNLRDSLHFARFAFSWWARAGRNMLSCIAATACCCACCCCVDTGDRGGEGPAPRVWWPPVDTWIIDLDGEKCCWCCWWWCCCCWWWWWCWRWVWWWLGRGGGEPDDGGGANMVTAVECLTSEGGGVLGGVLGVWCCCCCCCGIGIVLLAFLSS